MAAGVLFAVGSAVHMLDHLRRGQGSVTEALYWTGNLALVVQVVVITLIFTRHRLAPLAAAAVGFPLALGFFAAHWLPELEPAQRPAVGDRLVDVALLRRLDPGDRRGPGRGCRRPRRRARGSWGGARDGLTCHVP